MVIDMKKDKLVIMDWGGVVESHSEESYLAHNVVKHVLEQFTTEPLPHNFNEVFEQSLMVDGVPINEIAGTKKLQAYLDKRHRQQNKEILIRHSPGIGECFFVFKYSINRKNKKVFLRGL